MRLDQLAVAFRFLERIEVLPLNILNQRQLRGGGIVDLPDDCRDGVDPRLLRRSPATIRKSSPSGFRRIGWSTPRSRIESASSESAASSNCTRGWFGFGLMRAMSISRTPPRCCADSPVAGAGAGRA